MDHHKTPSENTYSTREPCAQLHHYLFRELKYFAKNKVDPTDY